MVRITTVWDKIEELVDDELVINQHKVFMLRGDEAYARTTDIIFTITNINTYTKNSQGYVLTTGKVQVLRDIGESTITIHDGDTVLSVIEWTPSTKAQPITIPRLSWNNTHELWVSYDGNNQCLKSASDKITVSHPNPDLTDTTLVNNNPVVNYTSTDEITLSVKLSKKSGTASLENRDIHFFVDDVDYNTVKTDANGVASLNIGRQPNGVNTVSAFFDGDDPLGESSVTYNLYIGYIVTIEEYPRVFINGVENTVKVSVKDYEYNPINHIKVHFGEAGTNTAFTDSKGIATLKPTSMRNNVDYFAYLVDATYYTSEIIRAYSTTLDDISITCENDYVGRNSSNKLTVALAGTNLQSNIAVNVMTEVQRDRIWESTSSNVDGTHYTDNNGVLELDYVGDARGNIRITATVGELSNEVSFNDVYSLISLPSIYLNQGYVPYGNNPVRLNNGMKLVPSASNGSYMLFQSLSSDESATIDFEISAPSTTKYTGRLVVGYYNARDGLNTITLTSAPHSKGALFRILQDKNICTVNVNYKNNGVWTGWNTIATFTWKTGRPVIGLIRGSGACDITLNDIMIRRN